jgi:hypothetical protein
MPDSPEVEQNFNAPVYGVAGKVENQIIYASSQKQDLAEAAAEIQRLLKQLEETNPTATEKKKGSLHQCGGVNSHQNAIARGGDIRGKSCP